MEKDAKSTKLLIAQAPGTEGRRWNPSPPLFKVNVLFASCSGAAESPEEDDGGFAAEGGRILGCPSRV